MKEYSRILYIHRKFSPSALNDEILSLIFVIIMAILQCTKFTGTYNYLGKTCDIAAGHSMSTCMVSELHKFGRILLVCTNFD